jgi:DNA mismatch repair ATPase MutL
LVIKLDLSRLPTTLKSIIINQTKSTEQVKQDPDEPDVVILQGEIESENDIDDVKRKIKDLLIQFKISEYVAITDPLDNHKILIVAKKDAEILDSFHCHHCGMEFIDEIQLGIHQRLHLPF